MEICGLGRNQTEALPKFEGEYLFITGFLFYQHRPLEGIDWNRMSWRETQTEAYMG